MEIEHVNIINMSAPNLSYAEIVSSLALLISILALGWNIIKHFVQDKIKVEFSIAFGEVGNIESSQTALFADAGSLRPDHKFDNPGMLIQAVNTGRRPIVLSSVGGKSKDGQGISMTIDDLPKMIHPYEIFQRISHHPENLLERIRKEEIEDLWIKDSKGKKWSLSGEAWKRLESTADYILSNKHI